jgi:hypothetical protein
VAAGALVIVVILYGTGWLALTPLVVLLGWARVATGVHSAAQASAGAVLGGAIAAAVFPLLR